MMYFKMIKKREFDDFELESAFNIVKLNMIQLGYDVNDNDRKIWLDSVKNHLKNPNFYFYLIYLNDEIVGFVQIVNKEDSFFVSEVQLSEKVKRTRAILEIIKFLFSAEELKNATKANFSILKINNMSNKTFSHLGGKIVSENERKFEYEIDRESVEKYLSKFNLKN